MKKFFVLGMSLCIALAFTSCKSSESAYKKAYEKAKMQEAAEPQSSETPVAVTPVVTPVTTVTVPTTDVSNVTVRSEKVTLVTGSNIQDYNVVVGSFGLQANADGLRNTLVQKGYNAIVVSAQTAKGLMYRVIAATYADKASAAQARETLRGTYPDAWLLYNAN